MASSVHLRFRLSSPDHTDTVGYALGRLMRAGDVLALDGDLGAGKTTLIRGIAAGLGLDPRQVSSPTFVLIARYDAAAHAGVPATPLVHADAYRLSGADDLESAGWAAALGTEQGATSDAVACVEWASKVAALLGPGAARANLEHIGPTERGLALSCPIEWTGRLPAFVGLRGLAGRTDAAPCPTCGKTTPPDHPLVPFCSARCRDADLGRWLSGQYVVSRELQEDDLSAPSDERG
ncbi:MAG: tRNA (adenosine(37)-N6)-threonylcarbamoyltransferase complex ATPase subunit type 1 TsaE [Phycisphaerales bacterium]